MLKSDQLYQIYMRLQEITQDSSDFGGVAILLCGDLMQLQPVRGTWIFYPPKDRAFETVHELYPLWEQFVSIVLTKNHRQGEDHHYAEMLNRIRLGEQTEEDIKTLESRQTNEIPVGALHIYGKREQVHQ